MSRVPRAAHELSSLKEPTQNFKAAESTKANPYEVEPLSIPQLS